MSVDSMTEKLEQYIRGLNWAGASDDERTLAVGNIRGAFMWFREQPIDMLLFCPRCNAQHVDAPQPEKNWDNPPHRSHECQKCGFVWRPADVPTNGVATIQTKGQRDGNPTPSR